jgi:hypothetical protein
MPRYLDQKTIFTPALIQRLSQEAEGEAHVVYFKAEGTTHCHRSQLAPRPDALQDMIARDIVTRFNRELAFGGTWLVELTHLKLPSTNLLVFAQQNMDAPVYGCTRFLWMDEDGDIRLPVECWDSPVDMAMAGMVHFMDQANDAWTIWKQTTDVLDLSAARGEVKMVAKGEAMAATHVDIDLN